ncbi:MAG: type II secretion system protein GspM [Burkholderiaceae bacterium]
MSAAPPTLSHARQQVARRWAALASRERYALVVVLLVLGLFIVWSVLIQPAWRTLRDAPAAHDRFDTQLQDMHRLAAEIRELRGATAVSATQAGDALKAATARLGESGKLAPRGERAVLALNNASPEGLRAWLIEARSAARARPVELQLQRTGQGYSGSVTVTLPGAP